MRKTFNRLQDAFDEFPELNAAEAQMVQNRHIPEGQIVVDTVKKEISYSPNDIYQVMAMMGFSTDSMFVVAKDIVREHIERVTHNKLMVSELLHKANSDEPFINNPNNVHEECFLKS